MTNQIPLTQGKFAIVDDDDFEWLSAFKWQFTTDKYGNDYARRKSHGRHIIMHREIMQAAHGIQVDHVDGHGLNNKRSNLRFATHAQNMMNKSVRRDSTVCFKGVRRRSPSKWDSRITANKKCIYLGYFKSPEDAARAYNEAAIKYHGEFAHLNIVP